MGNSYSHQPTPSIPESLGVFYKEQSSAWKNLWSNVTGATKALPPVNQTASYDLTYGPIVSQEVASGPYLDRETKWALIQLGLRLLLATGLSYVMVRMLVKAMDPTSAQKDAAKKMADQLLRDLGVNRRDIQLDEHELQIAQHLTCTLKNGINWEDIGGCEDEKQQLQDRLILPLQLSKQETSGNELLSPPKGVLLYGPPGCGKTLLAKAVARAAGARFINLQISTLTDKWYGESQKLASAVFSLAKKIQPSIIFIDEIDSFLRSRDSIDHEATAMMKTQFMSHWDGFSSDTNCHVIILGATNRPQDVDKAILRRMPVRLHVGLPTEPQRLSILTVALGNVRLADDVDMGAVARDTQGLSGCDLTEVVRLAALERAKQLISNGIQLNTNEAKERPVTQHDLQRAVQNYRGTDDPLFSRDFSGRNAQNIGLD